MADFLDEIAPMPEATEPEVPAVEVQPEPALEPAPEPEAAPAPTPEAQPVQQQEHSVPLPKYLDTRDELKEARRRIAEYEAQKAPSQRPDPLDDPDGFRAALAQETESRIAEVKFSMSDAMARNVHGADTVDQALQWATEKATADPVFAASYMREANPVDWIVRQHKQQAIVAQLPSDISSLDELIEREIARRGLVAPAVAAPVPTVAAVTQPAGKPPAPPRSIASDAPANAPAANDARAEFLAIFDRK